MNFILTTITIMGLSICGANKSVVKEDLEILKKQSATSKKTIVYKKVPTKWIKTDKNSN
jgi:hypothetical protein